MRAPAGRPWLERAATALAIRRGDGRSSCFSSAASGRCRTLWLKDPYPLGRRLLAADCFFHGKPPSTAQASPTELVVASDAANGLTVRKSGQARLSLLQPVAHPVFVKELPEHSVQASTLPPMPWQPMRLCPLAFDCRPTCGSSCKEYTTCGEGAGEGAAAAANSHGQTQQVIYYADT